MLTALHIENIAIIEQIDIDFANGFSVLTGETGAGKSIIIDSILLLLGNKASKELIRSGAEYAIVSASFCDLPPESLDILHNNGVSPDEEGNIAVFRRIARDGRSIVKINGINVPVTALKELGTLLISIHGQHDGVMLLDSRRHLSYLDEYAESNPQLSEYRKAYVRVKTLRDQIQILRAREAEKEKRREQLTAWIVQLDSCELREGEYEDLMQKRAAAINAAEITEALQQATSALYEGDLCADHQVKYAMETLNEAVRFFPQAAPMIERLKPLSAELGDIGAEVGKWFDQYLSRQMDPETIEARLDQLEAIKKAFGPDDRDVLKKQRDFRKELENLDSGEEILRKTELEFSEAHRELEAKAEELSRNRVNAAKKLEKQLRESLTFLDMPHIQFKVQILNRQNERGGIRYRSDGKDDVEFFISTNPGEPLKPLNKVASGGELSRIMLSIKSVLNHGFDTVIYDEIDTGVSGATAEKIGKKLHAGANDRQVICITHLAQIAALADHHYRISKIEEDRRTKSMVQLLSPHERINEIARIMGGENITETLLQSAEEMLKKTK